MKWELGNVMQKEKDKVQKSNEKRIGATKDSNIRTFVKVSFVRLTTEQLLAKRCNAYQYVI